MRTETISDPDKTMVKAIQEMISEEEDEELEEMIDEEDQSFVAGGRIADEMEHLVFSPEEEDVD